MKRKGLFYRRMMVLVLLQVLLPLQSLLPLQELRVLLPFNESFQLQATLQSSCCAAQVTDLQFKEPNVLMRGRTFHGQITATFPMAFIDCIFVGDGKPVLKSTDGAIFLNCCFRTDGDGQLYMAGSGNNIVMVDCYLIGYDGFCWSENIRKSDRNYVSGLTLNGTEFSLESDANTIEMDGLDIADSFREVHHGDIVYKVPGMSRMARISASDYRLTQKDESVKLTVEGVDDGTFVGWWTDDELVRLVPGPEPMACMAILNDNVRQVHDAMVNVVTETGLELAVLLQVGNNPGKNDAEAEKATGRKNRKNRKRLSGN